MKYYCQFKKLSTGYIQGTIPPEFDENNKKPIDMVGSDGIMWLDGRCSIETMMNLCEKRMKEINAIGYKIISASNLRQKGRVIYSYLKPLESDFFDNKIFYSHGKHMTLEEFVKVEFIERHNYSFKEIHKWIEKYELTRKSKLIWVTPDKRKAYTYVETKDKHDQIMNHLYDWEIANFQFAEYTLESGRIIDESDDGDFGFLMVLND